MIAPRVSVCLTLLCFKSWHDTLSELRNQSIGAIERALAFEQAFNDRLGVIQHDGKAKLVIGDNLTSVSSLSDTLDLIGERVLDNKRNSDLINLLIDEYESTVISMNDSKRGLDTLPTFAKRILAEHSKLEQNISRSIDEANRLDGHIGKYQSQLSDIKQNIPDEARLLIEASKGRSHNAYLEASRTNCAQTSEFDKFISSISPELEKVRFRKRQMNFIGTRILNNSLLTHLPDYVEGKFRGKFFTSVEDLEGSVIVLGRSAKSLHDSTRRLIEDHRTEADSRAIDIRTINEIIGSANITIQDGTSRLFTFKSTFTEIKSVMEALGKVAHANSSESRLSANQTSQSSLKSTISELELKKLTLTQCLTNSVNESKRVQGQLADLSRQIDEAIDVAIPHLIKLDGAINSSVLNSIPDLRTRALEVVKRLTQLHEKTVNLTIAGRATKDAVDRAKDLLSTMKLDALNATSWMKDKEMSCAQLRKRPKVKGSDLDLGSFRKMTQELAKTSKRLLELVREYRKHFLGRQLTRESLIKLRLESLNESTKVNKDLIDVLRKTFKDISYARDLLISNKKSLI